MIKTVGITMAVALILPVGAAELPQIYGIDESLVLENYSYTSIADEIDQIVNGSGVIAEKSLLPENSDLSNSRLWDFPPLPDAAEEGSQSQEFEKKNKKMLSSQNKEITVYRRKNLLDDLKNLNKTEQPILPEIEGKTGIGALTGVSDIKGLVRE